MQSQLSLEKERITHKVKHSDDTETNRDITVINGCPFYCSSGENSGMPDTWLPFAGLNEDGGLIKPCALYTRHVLQMVDFMGDDFIKNKEYLDSVNDTTLARFGNIETAYISYALGGGIWNDSETGNLDLRNAFTKYFENNFPFLIDNQISITPFSEFTTSEVAKVNEWLRGQGADLGQNLPGFDSAYKRLSDLNNEQGKKPAAYIRQKEENTLIDKATLKKLQDEPGNSNLVDAGQFISYGRGDDSRVIPVLEVMTNNKENNTYNNSSDKTQAFPITMFRGNKPVDRDSTANNQF